MINKKIAGLILAAAITGMCTPCAALLVSAREIVEDVAEEVIELAPEETVEIVSSGETDAEALFAGYAEKILNEGIGMGNNARPVFYAARRDYLSDKQRVVYDKLKERILKVANGEMSDTRVEITMADLGLKTSYTFGELGLSTTASQDSIQSAVKSTIGDYNLVIDALLTDLPLELYWFDKSTGYSTRYPGMTYVSSNISSNTRINLNGGLQFGFFVVHTYSASGELQTLVADTAKTGAAMKARTKAQEIVAAHAAETDVQKLASYRDVICDLTDYNHAAVNNSVDYGDPWQLIWVFDGDPSTKVVCEGYSKAFQYLCDLSTFADSRVESQIMTGWSNGGLHMWNVVRMDNGYRYLADITNCDGSGLDRYFLKGAATGSATGYEIFYIKYVYDSDTIALYTAQERTLSTGVSYEEDVRSGKGETAPEPIDIRVSGVALNRSTASVEKGKTLTLTATVSPANAWNKNVSWRSSNTGVASVSAFGVVTARAVGKAVITATTEDGGYSASCTVTVGTWKYDGKGWWYQFSDGTYPKATWQQINDKWYYFNAAGYMQTGWMKVGGKWYFLNSSGAMQTGWLKQGSTWYYLNGAGAMQTGWTKVSGKWYYMNSSGAMQTGWVKVNGKWYYMNTSGIMQTGWLKIGGKWYYMNGSGAMTTGWQKIDGKWYYMNGSGVMTTGWQKIGGRWYYMDSSGVMLSNTSRRIGGKTYYFNDSGVCMNP